MTYFYVIDAINTFFSPILISTFEFERFEGDSFRLLFSVHYSQNGWS